MKNNDRILTNLDGEAVMDKQTGEILMEFDPEQKAIIRECIEKGWPVQGMAYSGVHAWEMALIRDIVLTPRPIFYFDQMTGTVKDLNEKGESFGISSQGYAKSIDIWKTVHTAYNDPRCFGYVLYALSKNVRVLDNIDSVYGWNAMRFEVIAYAAASGKDYCKKVSPDRMPYDQLYTLKIDMRAKMWKVFESQKQKRKMKNMAYGDGFVDDALVPPEMIEMQIFEKIESLPMQDTEFYK